MYSLLNTAKLNAINPQAYFHHLLSEIVDYQANRVDDRLLNSVCSIIRN